MSHRLREKVGQVRRSQMRQSLWTQSLRLTLLVVVLLSVMAVLDYCFVLPTAVRAATLLAAVVFAAVRGWQIVAAGAAYDVGDAAADVEERFPEHGQRIRTTLDYSDPQTRTAEAASGLVRRLEAETEQRTEPQDFQHVVDRRPLGLVAAGLAAATLAAGLLLLLNPELRVGLRRALLFSSHYTQLTVRNIEEPIPAGQDAKVVATIEGRPVKSAQLLYRAVGQQQWQQLPLQRPSAERGSATQDFKEESAAAGVLGEVSATLQDCQQDLEYQVVAGPLASEMFRLQVLAPLELKQLAAEVRPPQYTKLKPESTDSLDLKVVEGSDIDFTLTLSRAAAEARLHQLADSSDNSADLSHNSPLPLQLDGDLVKGRFADLRESQLFVISAQAADGMQYRSPRFRIRVRPDGAPQIRFVKPPEDLEVVPTAEVTLSVDAEDDFGIRKLGIAAQVSDGPLQTLWEQDYPSGDDDKPLELRAQPVLHLEDHQLTIQDAVTYYAYVVDNRPGEGKRSITELRFIDIRPFKREYQFLDGGGT